MLRRHGDPRFELLRKSGQMTHHWRKLNRLGTGAEDEQNSDHKAGSKGDYLWR